MYANSHVSQGRSYRGVFKGLLALLAHIGVFVPRALLYGVHTRAPDF